LFIGALAVIPFIDRYKKLSWKDRPLITAFGITGIAQVIVTTYWGFYIDPDITKSLTERLVIDPILLYTVMLLLVPLSFGFTYMMIKLARHAEMRAKLEKKKEKQSFEIPINWTWILLFGLVAFQVYLNIMVYYAGAAGFRNFQLFLIGVVLLTFGALFHVYRYAMQRVKTPSKPPAPKVEPKPKPIVVKPAPKKKEEPAVAEVKVVKPGKVQATKPSPTNPSNINPNPSGSLDMPLDHKSDDITKPKS
jgi:ubiquinol-cytochrome c reductase cytochrome b subunit